LQFQETGDRQNFQGRYVLRHPYEGEASCEAAAVYRRDLQGRQDREVHELASLTGWKIETLRAKAGLALSGAAQPFRWWEWLR
jgi:hypothetical protein